MTQITHASFARLRAPGYISETRRVYCVDVAVAPTDPVRRCSAHDPQQSAPKLCLVEGREVATAGVGDLFRNLDRSVHGNAVDLICSAAQDGHGSFNGHGVRWTFEFLVPTHLELGAAAAWMLDWNHGPPADSVYLSRGDAEVAEFRKILAAIDESTLGWQAKKRALDAVLAAAELRGLVHLLQRGRLASIRKTVAEGEELDAPKDQRRVRDHLNDEAACPGCGGLEGGGHESGCPRTPPS